MSDIVERLRRLAERERPYGSLPDTLDEAAVEIERLRDSLKRMLLEFDFMIECGVIPDVRDDVIFVEARAALNSEKD